MDMPRTIAKTEHALPELPYAMNALEPFMSRETLEYHYGKHHRAYVNKLNALVAGTEFEGETLEDIMKKSTGSIFNNAAQVWNHSFFWRCLAPKQAGVPPAELAAALHASFGSIEAFKERFKKSATEKFGSGWTWLVRTKDGKLAVRNTDDADNPLRAGDRPLLTCDVWEHAYYIDYRNDRAKYVDAFWNVVNWKFVAENLAGHKR